MSRLPALFIEIVDSTGSPVSGGKAYFYESGTTNLLATYSDAAKKVANTNPVVAGADGKIGPVYMTDNTAYTVVEKDASDVTLRSQDGVYSGLLSSNTFVANAPYTSPFLYGAIGDGVANEFTEVQAAIDAAGDGGIVDLGGGIFRCDSQLTITYDRFTLRNGKLDFTSCGDDEGIKVHGTLGANNLFTSNGTAGDNFIALTSLSGLSVGDLLNVQDTTAAPGTNAINGELVEISSLNTIDDEAWLERYLFGTYTTANGARVNRVTAVEDLLLENLEIVGGPDESISLVNCRRATVVNVHFNNVANGPGIMVSGCLDVKIDKCRFRGDTTQADEGIVVTEASQYITVSNSRFIGVKSAILISSNASIDKSASADGLQRHIKFLDCDVSLQDENVTGGSFIFVDKSTEFVTFSRCAIQVHATAGTLMGLDGPAIEVLDCNISASGGPNIKCIRASSSTVNMPSVSAHYFKLVGNTIYSEGEAIRCNLGGPDVNKVILSDNDVECVDVIFIDTLGGQTTLPSLIISDNKFAADLTVSCASAYKVTNCFISNTMAGDVLITRPNSVFINNCVFDTLDMTDVVEFYISDLVMDGTVSGNASLEIDSTNVTVERGSISNCRIETTTASKHACLLTKMNALTVENNLFTMATGAGFHPLELAGTNTECRFLNNTFVRGDSLGAALELANITNGTVDYNSIENGDYGINCTGTNSKLFAGKANVFTGLTTGRINGFTNNPYLIEMSFWSNADFEDIGARLPDTPLAVAAVNEFAFGNETSLVSPDHDTSGGAVKTTRGVFWRHVPADLLDLLDLPLVGTAQVGVQFVALFSKVPDTSHQVRARFGFGRSFAGSIGDWQTSITTFADTYTSTCTSALGNIPTAGTDLFVVMEAEIADAASGVPVELRINRIHVDLNAFF